MSIAPNVSLRDQALQRIDALNLAQYARTRNALAGHVSQISPFITHGILDVPEVISRLADRERQASRLLSVQDKFVFELGWREYFHHAWRVLGDDIWTPQRAAPAAASGNNEVYSATMPDDVLNAATGIAVIDDQIRTLYETGYLHNHARMWIASYLVHLRKVDWRVGARWMYGYLLDGDMASNTLSWQWVAGTWTGKPYLFNAENVEKYAPGFDHSGSIIDQSYEALEVIARNPSSSNAVQGARSKRTAQTARTPPPLFDASVIDALANEMSIETVTTLPAGFHGELRHPWSLKPGAPSSMNDSQLPICIIVPAFHAAHPWSEARWRFVMRAINDCGAMILSCESASHLQRDLHTVAPNMLSITETYNPHYNRFISALSAIGASTRSAPRAFIDPPGLQRSFTRFWQQASQQDIQYLQG
jgi:deoxyribodipyrimidine photo-lyase